MCSVRVTSPHAETMALSRHVTSHKTPLALSRRGDLVSVVALLCRITQPVIYKSRGRNDAEKDLARLIYITQLIPSQNRGSRVHRLIARQRTLATPSSCTHTPQSHEDLSAPGPLLSSTTSFRVGYGCLDYGLISDLRVKRDNMCDNTTPGGERMHAASPPATQPRVAIVAQP